MSPLLAAAAQKQAAFLRITHIHVAEVRADADRREAIKRALDQPRFEVMREKAAQEKAADRELKRASLSRSGRGDDDCRDDREAEYHAKGKRAGGQGAHGVHSLPCEIKNLRAIVDHSPAP
jgi:hypothetical protein